MTVFGTEPVKDVKIQYKKFRVSKTPIEIFANIYSEFDNCFILESVIATQEAAEGKLTKTEIAEQVKRGRVWANKMWNEGKVNDVKWQKSPIAAAIKAWEDYQDSFYDM